MKAKYTDREIGSKGLDESELGIQRQKQGGQGVQNQREGWDEEERKAYVRVKQIACWMLYSVTHDCCVSADKRNRRWGGGEVWLWRGARVLGVRSCAGEQRGARGVRKKHMTEKTAPLSIKLLPV